jgi:hypothetical protein
MNNCEAYPFNLALMVRSVKHPDKYRETFLWLGMVETLEWT